MAQQLGDTQKLARTGGTQADPTVHYATRGAGLYSEVTWDPVPALRARTARTADEDSSPRPISPA